jgi:hypothetical protein
MVHWVYILECNDNFVYVGETSFIYKRLKQHIKGCGGKNTHNHYPKQLLGLYKVNENQSYIQYLSAINNGIDIRSTIDSWGSWGDNLYIENKITERLIYERRSNHEYGTGIEWYRVRGGKYTKGDLDETLNSAKEMCERPNRVRGTLIMTTPIDNMRLEDIVDRPLCHCNLPSEVKLSKKKHVYFVCCRHNIWDKINSLISVSPPCDFWKLHESH